jgi:hypothetical protein
MPFLAFLILWSIYDYWFHGVEFDVHSHLFVQCRLIVHQKCDWSRGKENKRNYISPDTTAPGVWTIDAMDVNTRISKCKKECQLLLSCGQRGGERFHSPPCRSSSIHNRVAPPGNLFFAMLAGLSVCWITNVEHETVSRGQDTCMIHMSYMPPTVPRSRVWRAALIGSVCHNKV